MLPVSRREGGTVRRISLPHWLILQKKHDGVLCAKTRRIMLGTVPSVPITRPVCSLHARSTDVLPLPVW